MSFRSKVYEVVSKIPAGKVASYKMVAEWSGYSGASRAVGTILKNNPNPFYESNSPALPCHRVVKSSGQVGNYSGGAKKKINLLKLEGVVVVEGKVSAKYYWNKK